MVASQLENQLVYDGIRLADDGVWLADMFSGRWHTHLLQCSGSGMTACNGLTIVGKREKRDNQFHRHPYTRMIVLNVAAVAYQQSD